MKITTSDFGVRGNAVAFTARGEIITCQASKPHLNNKRDWKVCVTVNGRTTLTNNALDQTFATKAEAAEYATSILDAEKTEELAWW